jgi:hypothetical protein
VTLVGFEQKLSVAVQAAIENNMNDEKQAAAPSSRDQYSGADSPEALRDQRTSAALKYIFTQSQNGSALQPDRFQLLLCSAETTMHETNAFLARVENVPDRSFAILYPELLSAAARRAVAEFLERIDSPTELNKPNGTKLLVYNNWLRIALLC